MQKGTHIPKPGLIIAALLMMMAMAWLTVSTPFVFRQQQQMTQEMPAASDDLIPEEMPNPLAGSTEEKTESGVNTLSEYLHDHIIHHAADDLLLTHGGSHHADEYVAYHGELHCPPPEI